MTIKPIYCRFRVYNIKDKKELKKWEKEHGW
jgi:hypothetical protein